jgi:folate-binding protein YgfZ
MTENIFFVTLPNRGLINLEGPDRHDFLQGLITNDIRKTAPDKIIYACLLTPQGKFLHDFFIHDTGDALLLDCEGGERAQDLYKRLTMYRLRKNVQISIEEKIPVYAVFGASIGLPDPRSDKLGKRSFEKPDLPEKPFEIWDHLRITLTIPDGSRDLIPDKSTMDEAHMDQIGAVDYEKGCYVGQELTARMHYRGLGKKHLQAVDLNNLPEKAELRSTCGDIGLALVRN